MKKIVSRIIAISCLVGVLLSMSVYGELLDSGMDEDTSAQIYICGGYVQTNAYGYRNYAPSVYQWGWQVSHYTGQTLMFLNEECVKSHDSSTHTRSHYCASCNSCRITYAQATVNGNYTIGGYN